MDSIFLYNQERGERMYKFECPYCGNIDFNDAIGPSISADDILECQKCLKKTSVMMLWR
jgi:predicted RNA-binding Zn-ribbon protein involved in translation (DUF1610 family)